MKPVTFNAPHDSGAVREVVGYPTGVFDLAVVHGRRACGDSLAAALVAEVGREQKETP